MVNMTAPTARVTMATQIQSVDGTTCAHETVDEVSISRLTRVAPNPVEICHDRLGRFHG
jgi:hypothetical protein